MLPTLLLTILCTTTGVHLMSLPVFGTKRYHRSPSVASSGHGRSNSPPSMPYYNQLSTYYDSQPMTSSSSSSASYGSPPISNKDMARNYQNGYLTENGYYYYPRHEYHSYGMPTYHGDYKPTPYYYAPAPRYSYYDDRDISSNPMDDLHEEILHEDERERLRELQPYGLESWYQTTTTNDDGAQQEELTNNFLKNLIEYNKQIDAQQKLQQQQKQELMQRDQEHRVQLQLQQQQNQQQQQQQHEEQQPYGDEYDEYVELGDYEYEPQVSENIYDMKKYEKQDNVKQHFPIPQQSTQNHFQPYHQQQLIKKPTKLNEIEDENVRQLKVLANQSNLQNQKLSSINSKPNNFKAKEAESIDDDDDDDNDDDDDADDTLNDNFYNYPLKSWKQPQMQQEHPTISSGIKSFAQYDNEPEEYDDDAWISWDRKRSPDNKKVQTNMEKWKQSLKKIEKITAFNNRKAQAGVVKNFKELPHKSISTISTKPSNKNLLSETTSTTIVPPDVVTTKFTGQKEVVLPRPASVSQIHMFPNYPMTPGENFDEKQEQINESDGDGDGDGDGKNDKRNAKGTKKSDNVYDTIKQLIAMDHQLDKTPSAKVYKRSFVTNEENLVHELNNLKRV